MGMTLRKRKRMKYCLLGVRHAQLNIVGTRIGAASYASGLKIVQDLVN